jgi:hypothetical protein
MSFLLLLLCAMAKADTATANMGNNSTGNLALLRPLNGVNTACTGNSSGLHPDQCLAYQEFFDATGGTGWTICKNKLDPCSCFHTGLPSRHTPDP